MGVRDDFSAATKRRLASQVGWLCSNPKCRRLTVAARQGQEGLTTIGVAAHIAAAAPGPGAARYDPTQTPEERKSIQNGIWLCAADAKIIDDDPQTYTVELLQGWKATAKHAAFLALSEPAGQGATPDAAPLGPPDEVTLFRRFLTAAARDILGFQRGPRWPAHPVSLTLRAASHDAVVRFTAETLAVAASVHDRLVLIAPPGTGKSTTLIQLSAAINAAGAQAAVYVPLGEWSIDRLAFLDVAFTREAYRDLARDDARTLARAGRLRLVLDGWNELDDDAQKVAAAQVIQLGRDFPLLGLVISTRPQALDLPFRGEQLTLEALNEVQQRDLAAQLGGARGEAALEYGWRTPGLSDLVALPLYLTALVAAAPPDTVYPATKDGVLALMVASTERAASITLRTDLDDRHTSILVALAVEMTRTGDTAMADDQARPVFVAETSRTGSNLPLQPVAALDLLVARHVLVRAGPKTFTFQHHQFQEWYASFEVERLIVEATTGPADAFAPLRLLIDDRRWEEAVLFACERLSRKGQSGAKAIAALIEDTLGLDPMLAGDMVYRSDPSVWAIVGDRVEPFARTWHAANQPDRALRLMMTTGRPEFADVIRPFLTSRAAGRHFEVLRLPARFHPAVLGLDAAVFLKTLGPDHLGEILAEIVDRGGVTGIDFAVSAAVTDGHDAVLTEVGMALLHRRAERAAEALLQRASPTVIETLAQRWGPESVSFEPLRRRLEVAKTAQDQARDEIETLRSILHEPALPEAERARLMALVARPDYPADTQIGRWMIDRAFELDRVRASEAIVARLEAGLETPFRIERRMRGSGVSRDSGPIIDRLLSERAEHGTLHAEALVAGPETVKTLLNRLLALEPSAAMADERQASERFWRQRGALIDILGDTDWPRLEGAVLALPDRGDAGLIGKIVDVLARALRLDDRADGAWDALPRPVVSAALSERLATWSSQLLLLGDAAAADRADLARVIGLAGVPLVREAEALFVAEAERLDRVEVAVRSGSWRRLPPEFRNSHVGSFRDALIDLGDHSTIERLAPWLDAPRVAGTTAGILAGIENRLEHRRETLFRDGFRRRAEPMPWLRLEATSEDAASQVHHLIIQSVRKLLNDGSDAAAPTRAAALACVAFGLPHERDDGLINDLLRLPLRFTDRQDLMNVLALIGEVLPAAALRDGIAAFHSEVGPHFHELERRHYQLDQWLALFLSSDAPSALIDALEGLQPFQRKPYRLATVIGALGRTASPVGDRLLLELARMDPEFTGDHGWRTAVLNRGPAAATETILTLIEEGVLKDWQMRGGVQDAGPVSEQLRAQPTLIGRLWDLYKSTDNPLLRRALIHSHSVDIVLALMTDDARLARPFNRDFEEAVYDLAIAHRPYRDTSAYEIVPVEAGAFRSALFHKALSGKTDGEFAAAALNHLDRLRDEYGAPQGERRHPDIATGKPWPILGGWSLQSAVTKR